MTATVPSGDNTWLARRGPVLALALFLLLVLSVRIRLLDTPLERDEGDHAYSAQLMLQGIAPWTDSYNMKLPGTDAMYALSMLVFGQTAAGIRIGLLIVNVATILLVFLVGRKLFGIAAGAVAGITFAVLSISQNIQATMAHATQFVACAAMAGILLLLKTEESPTPVRVFVTGLVFGVAFLMKQPGLFIAAFAALYLAWSAWRAGSTLAEIAKRLLLFGIGLFIPIGLLCLGLWRAGVFPRFWFWTVTLATEYASLLPLVDRVKFFWLWLPRLLLTTWPLWALALAGLSWALRNRSTRERAAFVAVFLAFSFIATASGGLFSPHHFILMLPAAGLAIGSAIPVFENRHKTVALSLFGLACLYSVAMQGRYLFAMTPVEVTRSTYGLSPFPEAVVISRYIESHSAPSARIAVMGSESEIYFYSRRRSASGFLFMYSLTEPSHYSKLLQDDIIRQTQDAKPEYIVYAKNRSSWFWYGDSDTSASFFYWLQSYLTDNYDLAADADIGPDSTKYWWGDQTHRPNELAFLGLAVYRRKPGAKY